MNDEPERRSAFSDDAGSQIRRIMQRGKEKQEQNQGRDGRGQPGRSGQVGTDSAGRSKATYGISAEAQEIARRIAEAEEISQADVVEAALRIFHQIHQAGKVDLHPFKAPARSLKATWKLERLDEINFFSG